MEPNRVRRFLKPPPASLLIRFARNSRRMGLFMDVVRRNRARLGLADCSHNWTADQVQALGELLAEASARGRHA